VTTRLNHGKAQEDHDISVLILSSNLATRLSRWAIFQTKLRTNNTSLPCLLSTSLRVYTFITTESLILIQHTFVSHCKYRYLTLRLVCVNYFNIFHFKCVCVCACVCVCVCVCVFVCVVGCRNLVGCRL